MEKTADVKHEFYKGEIVAMSGAGPRHNIIFSNLFGYFHQALFEKPSRPYGSDLRIYFPENTWYTYPDISIIYGGIIPTRDDEYAATHPIMIIVNFIRNY